MSKLLTNTTDLQEVLEALQTKAATEAVLPELANEGSAHELFSGKQLIDSKGNVVEGSFTIDNELTTQNDLITQIQTALEGKASGVVLPELSNPATAENLEEGYELIDGDGNIVVGTHVCSGGGGESGDIYYTPVQNNIPEEYGMLIINGVVCANNEITNVPFIDSPVMTFVFLPYDNSLNISYFEITYEYDDGEGNISTESIAGNYSIPEGTSMISGWFDTMYDPFTINIVLNE